MENRPFYSCCVIIGAFSLYFTDRIVSKLEEREKDQIQLYAESFKFMMTNDLDKDVNFFFEKIKKSNENITIPVILKDGSGYLTASESIQIPPGLNSKEQQAFLRDKLNEIMRDDNPPIELDMDFHKEYVYYGNSHLLNMLRFYPVFQLIVVLIFGLAAYLFFDASRRSEQNRVWVGLAQRNRTSVRDSTILINSVGRIF